VIKADMTNLLSYELSTYVVSDEGYIYEAFASPYGHPQVNRLGDIQKDKDRFTFDMTNVQCVSVGCQVVCQTKMQGVKLHRQANRPKLSLSKKNSHSIHVSYPFQLMFNLWVTNNKDIIELNPKAKCTLNIVSTWGCTKCDIQSNIVMQPSLVIQEGAFKLKSNCTLVSEIAICTNEPYTIDIMGKPEYCRLDSVTMNWTQTVKMSYFDEDGLTIIEGVISHAEDMSIVYNTLTDPSTLEYLTNTFAIGVSISTFLLLIRTIILTCMIRRNKDI
jgi:hypothetical protein